MGYTTSTKTKTPGINIVQQLIQQRNLENIKNSGYGKAVSRTDYNKKYSSNIAKRNKENAELRKKKSQSQSNGGGSSNESQETSSGSGITTLDDAGGEVLMDSGDGSGELSGDGTGSSDSSGTSGTTSPLLQGSMSFEELIREICDGLDLIFAVKRSTVVVTDYETIFAEAKYLRDNNHKSVKSEDMALWQLEEGSYELDVAEYGFYNTVKVKYKNGIIKESYDDLVRVYGEVVAEYEEPTIDKSTAIMKAKAYLAAHVRDFDMTVKASVLHDGDIDIGDIVTLDNPMTLRDEYRKTVEKRDPEYFFVSANSVSWDGDGYIKNDIEMRYGAKSPKKKDIPEMGTSYTPSSSSNVDSAIDEVGKKWSGMAYSGQCQTYSCVMSANAGDCWGCSATLSCELESRGVTTRILQYPTSSSSRHRSVQYKDSAGQWQDFPYREYGFNSAFNNTSGTKGAKEVSKEC